MVRKANSSKLREDALNIIKEGIRAVETSPVVRRTVSLKGNLLKVGNKTYQLQNFKRIFLIGFGKASLEACKELEKILGDKISAGVVIDLKKGKFKKIKSYVGTHPFPSGANVKATAQAVALLKQATAQDLVIAVVSGGGSALLSWPHIIKVSKLVSLTKQLMKKGATIQELNTVRKHLSEIQGGQFVKMAGPATVASLIFSDVPGDAIDVVASGPTVLDSTTVSDAKNVLKKYDLLDSFVQEALIETPKDANIFRKVQNVLAVSNSVAIRAMVKKGKELGYKTKVFSTALTGEAREVGKLLAAKVRPGEMLVAGGETTVTIKGKGKGGRNQELALGALASISDDSVLVSVNSDGHDNSAAAGAIADILVKRKAQKLKLDPEKYLKQNNSFAFFKRTSGHVMTGNTGVNIADLVVVVRNS